MADRVSMREASRVLTVSQIRVRELIRKGTLKAEKIVEDGAERWAIASESLHDYLKRRDELNGVNSNGGGPKATPAKNPQAKNPPANLLTNLEQATARASRLIAELQTLEKQLNAGVRSLRAASGPSTATKPSRPKAEQPAKAEVAKAETEAPAPEAEAPTTVEAPKAEAPAKASAPKVRAPKTEAPKAEAPETEAPAKSEAKAPKAAKAPAKPKKAAAEKKPTGKPKADTAVGAALRQAGITADSPTPSPKK